jgi:hypothetical protein
MIPVADPRHKRAIYRDHEASRPAQVIDVMLDYQVRGFKLGLVTRCCLDLFSIAGCGRGTE